MMKPWLRLGLGLSFVLGGCEHALPVAVQALPHPQQGSPSLSPAARELLDGKVDLSAMDRLLTTLGPEERTRFIRSFEDVEWAASGRTDVETRDVVVTVRFGDPHRQRLLEHAWAPFWSQLPRAVLLDASYPLPGRTLAGARRADSVSAVSKEREP